jgi:hypothetical protein
MIHPNRRACEVGTRSVLIRSTNLAARHLTFPPVRDRIAAFAPLITQRGNDRVLDPTFPTREARL